MKMSKLFSKLGEAFRSQKERFSSGKYDPKTQYPAIRASICTGEKVAGFRDRKSGKFTEVMLIRSPADLEEFKQRYGISGEIEKIY